MAKGQAMTFKIFFFNWNKFAKAFRASKIGIEYNIFRKLTSRHMKKLLNKMNDEW